MEEKPIELQQEEYIIHNGQVYKLDIVGDISKKNEFGSWTPIEIEQEPLTEEI